MSSSNLFMKPPVIITAVIVLALIGLSAGLRNKADVSDYKEAVERTEFDRIKTGETRISALSAPSSNIDGKGQATGRRAPAKKQGPREQIVENFDMAKRRAEGNSAITGRIFGNDRDNNGERGGWGRWGRGEDGNTSRSNEQRREWAQRRDNNTSESEQQQDWRNRFGDLKPLEMAEVQLYENDPNTTHPALRTVFTDKEGSFTIANVNGADQTYFLVVKHPNYAPEATDVTVTELPREVFMRLEKGVPLRGKVVDSETSEPISGAVVYQPNSLFEASSALGVTTTSITGEFYFPNTQPGGNMTMAHAKGYATTRARVRAPDEASIIEMQPGGATISGVTIDRLTGKPQGGARVWAKGDRDIAESVISADDGTFKIQNLPEGIFNVYAVRGMKSEEQEIELERGQEVADVEFILPAELLVSGQVVNSKDRKPLEGIKVWFQSSKGAQYRKTNIDGQFAFETMAIDEYAILIHEKGFLPIQDKKSTEAEETIVRKVAKNQSSDELTIRLRPVPTVSGTVTGESRRGNDGERPASGAEVRLAYEDGRDFYELKTKSDPAGNFFFNMPKGGRGQGLVVASHQFSMDSKDVRVPREKPIKLKLQREFMMGQVLLVDETPLDGISVNVSRALSANREDSNSAHRVTLANMDTMRGGRLFGPLPRGQQVDLTFVMPDGVAISKAFHTNRLLDSRPIFVYDPVSQDIITDTTPRGDREGRRGGDDSGRGWGGRGNRGPGGQGGQGNNQNGQNSNNQNRSNNPADGQNNPSPASSGTQ